MSALCSSRIRRPERRGGSEQGFGILALAATITIMTVMVGMAIDTGLMYLIKSKLSAACDAGAMAGARSLSIGGTVQEQRIRARQVAEAFMRVNFPSGTLMSNTLSVPTPVVDDTSDPNRRFITVAATVRPPSLFLRMLNIPDSTVSARAVAVRTDVNIMVVMDRSGSLAESGSCDALQAAAIQFVTLFAQGRDRIGLVTFGSSSATNYPVGTNFKDDLPPLINSITCNGATSSAAGLSRGYWELAGVASNTATNVIVFFTDGMPTAIDGEFPTVPACNGGNPVRGVWTAGYSGSTAVQILGLLRPEFPTLPVPLSDFMVAPDSAGCAYAASWPGSARTTIDYTNVPARDYWGNNLLNNYRTDYQTEQVNGQTYVRRDHPGSVSAASMNAAVHAADRILGGQEIRGRSLNNVTIYTIALGGTPTPAPHAFMLRVANDPTAADFDDERGRAGRYIFAASTPDLAPAFQKIASEIARLAE